LKTTALQKGKWPNKKKDLIRKHYKEFVKFVNDVPFHVWSRRMANAYQRNKQDFSYRNGCAKEIGKEMKVRKNKK
jgi:hypothetical protein